MWCSQFKRIVRREKKCSVQICLFGFFVRSFVSVWSRLNLVRFHSTSWLNMPHDLHTGANKVWKMKFTLFGVFIERRKIAFNCSSGQKSPLWMHRGISIRGEIHTYFPNIYFVFHFIFNGNGVFFFLCAAQKPFIREPKRKNCVE